MPPEPQSRPDRILALCAIIGAVLAIAVWIPLDTASGLVETVRRQVRVGDALGPTVAAACILGGGVLLLVRGGAGTPPIAPRNMAFLALLLGLFAVSIGLMRWTGPAAVALLGGEVETYRNLRDTAPWKYLGFLAGGGVMVFAMIARAERRVSWRAALIAALACLALVALYDLPFDDLLLPPNGDV